ncbi:hypothetical protein FGO68_gene6782 [Halteria grandinella]|uniref:RING-type domain-containing protein n=1 Tax=Halteria grandinella TaxID=5974 RepID=A0A8J8ND17_HALGN|nr:hypothetical protein FGO68_gene6782 [Halteria grandinella]
MVEYYKQTTKGAPQYDFQIFVKDPNPSMAQLNPQFPAQQQPIPQQQQQANLYPLAAQPQQQQPLLNFLEPGLYVSDNKDEPHLADEFKCLLCTSVVLRPVSCAECQTLFCKNCIKDDTMSCPSNKCGSKKYVVAHRILTNVLNSSKFRCKKAPDCDAIIPLNAYEQHIAQCPEMIKE